MATFGSVVLIVVLSGILLTLFGRLLALNASMASIIFHRWCDARQIFTVIVVGGRGFVAAPLPSKRGIHRARSIVAFRTRLTFPVPELRFQRPRSAPRSFRSYLPTRDDGPGRGSDTPLFPLVVAVDITTCTSRSSDSSRGKVAGGSNALVGIVNTCAQHPPPLPDPLGLVLLQHHLPAHEVHDGLAALLAPSNVSTAGATTGPALANPLQQVDGRPSLPIDLDQSIGVALYEQEKDGLPIGPVVHEAVVVAR